MLIKVSNNKNKRNNTGFTLIELMISLTIFAIMMSYAAVSFMEKRQNVGAEKLAQELNMIQAAAKKYYMDNKQFPNNLTDLQTNDYLGTLFPNNNPFGFAYTCSKTVSGTNQLFNIETRLPNQLLAKQIAAVVPGATVTTISGNYYVKATINIPGAEPSLENLLHRDAASTDEQRTMHGNIILDDGVALVDIDNTGTQTGYYLDPDSTTRLKDVELGDNVLYVNSATKRVGINTGGLNNAQEALHVVGNIRVNKPGDTTLNDEYMQFNVTNTNASINTDRGTFQLQFSGSPLITALNTGQVGINTTTPTQALDVNGNIKWGTNKGLLTTDQGASIELGGTGFTPYIDFANNDADDYDVRLLLTGDDELTLMDGQLNLAYNRTRISGFDGSGNHWVRYNQTDDNDLIMGIHRNGQNNYDLQLNGNYYMYDTVYSGTNTTFGRFEGGTYNNRDRTNIIKGIITQAVIVANNTRIDKPQCNGSYNNAAIYVAPVGFHSNGKSIIGVESYAESYTNYWIVRARIKNADNNYATGNNNARLFVLVKCI